MLSFLAALATIASPLMSNHAPAPYGPVPSPRQIQSQKMEFYGFIHFTTNTFTDKEWGYGDEPESVFNPTDFSADQIVRTAKEAGLKGLVLTTKHHDGFCLWPSKYGEHTIAKSPYRNGKGDIVREISDACRKYHIKFGVYLSPWDRNHPKYGQPEYITYYRSQLRELLTNYGPIFEVWFDGANGGDGYYGGAKEMRRIDAKTYYDWPNTISIVRDLQPEAVIFSDTGPDLRWVGNEEGFAGDPCWATINTDGWWPGHADPGQLTTGHRNGKVWLPAEVDVSIRPGWFYHKTEDDKVRSGKRLFQHWFESVGRGANLILNLPPDRRGQIHENDVAALRDFRRLMDETFTVDFARKSKASVSNVRAGDLNFGPRALVDGREDTYWSTDDHVKTPEATLEFKEPTKLNVVRIREYIQLGQRVDDWAIDTWHEDGWKEYAHGTAIGSCRLVHGPTVTTTKLRLRITKSPVCPAISELSVFCAPDGV